MPNITIVHENGNNNYDDTGTTMPKNPHRDDNGNSHDDDSGPKAPADRHDNHD